MKGIPLLQFPDWDRNESSLEVVSIQVCITALKELLHGFFPGLFSEHPSVYPLEAVVLVDCIAFLIAILAEVEVFTIIAVVSYVEDRLNITVVALVVGKYVAWLADLFSEVFLRSIGESFALGWFGYEVIGIADDLRLTFL